MTDGTCGVAGCSDPVYVKRRGLCLLHYGRWYRANGKDRRARLETRRKRGEPCVSDGCSGAVLTECRGLCQTCYSRWRETGVSDVPLLTCDDCGVEFRRRRWPGKRTFCSKRCERRTMHRGRSSARKRVETAGDDGLDYRYVHARDGGICGICGYAVDITLDRRRRMSATLDHIVPISRGGTHVDSNVQLAHRACNSVKRDSMPKRAR